MRPEQPQATFVREAAEGGDALAAGAPATAGQPGYRVIALVVAFALFMQQLDATVLSIALPSMSRDLGTSAAELGIALTAYLVALAMFIPVSGWLADRLGSRTVFCAAIAVFVAGSVACAQSTSLAFLVAARFLQGFGGAMMVPVGRLVLLRNVAKEDLVGALSWLVMPALIGPLVGPPLGGLIVTYLDWRWIFYLNVPIGLVGFVLAAMLIPQVRVAGRASLDRRGFLLSGVGLGSLVFGLELVSRSSPLPLVILLLGGGILLLALYVRHARGTNDPLLDLSLLRVASFRLSVGAGTLARVAQGAQPFLLPLMLQLALGFSPASAGAIMMASAVGALAMKPIAPMLIRRFGYRACLTAAGLAASACFAICGLFRADWPVAAMAGVLAACGFFTSLLFAGYNALAFLDLDDARTSAATSLYGTVQQIGLSLGICSVSALLQLAQFGAGQASPLSLAFVALAGAMLLSTLANLKLPR